jgi:hypothetical protein
LTGYSKEVLTREIPFQRQRLSIVSKPSFWAVGKSGVEDIRKAMEKTGLDLNSQNPEIVVVLGGDGSILRTNREFPNSSVLPIIKESFGGLAELRYSQFDYALEKMRKGEYEVEEVMRVEVQYKDFKTWAMNEVAIYRDDEQCNRMKVFSDGKDLYEKELIGDGMLACTASGSTGYCYAADGDVLSRAERKFQIVPLYCNYMGNDIVNGRRVLTRVRGGKVFPEGKEVIIAYNKKIKNKIVPDSIQSERRYFDFDVGDEVIVRSSKENGRFVKLI